VGWAILLFAGGGALLFAHDWKTALAAVLIGTAVSVTIFTR
jgi:hypothetical protein